MKLKDALIFLFGAATGAAVIWMLTSDEGKKTMEEIKNKFGEKLKDLGVDPGEFSDPGSGKQEKM